VINFECVRVQVDKRREVEMLNGLTEFLPKSVVKERLGVLVMAGESVSDEHNFSTVLPGMYGVVLTNQTSFGSETCSSDKRQTQ
jgi:hypothetical protein